MKAKSAPNALLKKAFAKSVGVTHEMRQHLISKCNELGIQVVVAPYEADSQLALLSHKLIVDFVITEDGDALAYACPRVLFKLEPDGHGQEIEHYRIGENDSPSFANWSQEQFLTMCILAGCDYAPSIKNLGIVKAHKIVRAFRKPSKVLKAIHETFGPNVPPSFDVSFVKALLTFRHQRVFNPDKKCVEMLHPPDLNDWAWRKLRGGKDASNPLLVGETDFLGREMTDELGLRVAIGLVHPALGVAWDSLEEEALDSITSDSARSTRVNLTAELEEEEGNTPTSLPPESQQPLSHQPPQPQMQGREELKEPSSSPVPMPPSSAITSSVPLPRASPKIGAQQLFVKNVSSLGHVPVKSEQYHSQLLGIGFETLSRRQTRRGTRAELASKPAHMWALSQQPKPQHVPSQNRSRQDGLQAQLRSERVRGRRLQRTNKKVGIDPMTSASRMDLPIRDPRTMSARGAMRNQDTFSRSLSREKREKSGVNQILRRSKSSPPSINSSRYDQSRSSLPTSAHYLPEHTIATKLGSAGARRTSHKADGLEHPRSPGIQRFKQQLASLQSPDRSRKVSESSFETPHLFDFENLFDFNFFDP